MTGSKRNGKKLAPRGGHEIQIREKPVVAPAPGGIFCWEIFSTGRWPPLGAEERG